MLTVTKDQMVNVTMSALIATIAATWIGSQVFFSLEHRVAKAEIAQQVNATSIDDIEVRMALNAVREDIREVESELRELERLLATSPDAKTVEIVNQQKRTLNAAKVQMDVQRDCLQEHRDVKLCTR